MSVDAFLSYTNEDAVLAKKLSDDLQRAGADVWVDRQAIPAGSEWAQEIEHAISNARNILFLLPKNSGAAKSWQSSEIALAVASQRSDPTKRIIPLITNPESAAELPYFLSRFQAADLSTDKAYREALPELIRLIRTTPQPESLEASDRLRQEMISVQMEDVRHRELAFQETTKRANTKLSVGLVSGIITFLIAVGAVLGAIGWIGEKTTTTFLSGIIGATLGLMAPLIQRSVSGVVAALVRRRDEVKR